MKTPGSAASAPSGAPDRKTAVEALTHFGTAFGFLIVGLAALVWNSGRLSQGLFFDPKVLAGLHLITLGWLSLSIFGALRVFTGVALGTQGFATGLVPWIRRLWVVGALLFPLGLAFQLPLGILVGVSAIGVALTLFTIHVVPSLVRSRRGGLTRGFLAIALVSLWGTWLLGATAASARAGAPIAPLPAGYLLAHILFSVFGWVGAMVVGVGSHLIPMFALSRDSSRVPVKVALPVWATIPVFAAWGAFHPDPYLILGFVAAAIGSALWFLQVAIYLREKLRHERDPGLFLAGGATLLLIAAWIVGATAKMPIPFIGLVVIGWLTLFTLGIYHRVIPFLVWFARFARRAGRGPVPKVKELIDERLGMATAISALGGAVTWAFGLVGGGALAVYLGSTLVLIGCVLAIGQWRTLSGEPRRPAEGAPSAVLAKGGYAS